MDKYVFLDIDGVLALERSEYGSDDQCLRNLGFLLHATDAKIVVTSSWRFPSVEETKEHLKSKGFPYTDLIVGVTIRAYHYIDLTTKIHLSIPRGVEIKQWLDTHIHSNNGKNFSKKIVGKDFTYVILDDDTDMLLEHANHFIHCDSEIGLNTICTDFAIQILNKQS